MRSLMFAAVIALTACTTTPRTPHPSLAFVPGVTTETDVERSLRKPVSSFALKNGNQVFVYQIGQLAMIRQLAAPPEIQQRVQTLRTAIAYVRSAGMNGFAAGLGAAAAPHMLTPVPMGEAFGLASQAAQQAQANADQLEPLIHKLAAMRVVIGFTPAGKLIGYVIVR